MIYLLLTLMACICSTFDQTHNSVLRTDLDSPSQDKANDTTPDFSGAVLRTAVSRYTACTAISLAESRDMPNLYRGTTLDAQLGLRQCLPLSCMLLGIQAVTNCT